MEMKPEYNHGTFVYENPHVGATEYVMPFQGDIFDALSGIRSSNLKMFFANALNEANEFALDKWALANGVNEAYRCIAISHTFGSPNITRLWWHEGSGWIICKLPSWFYLLGIEAEIEVRQIPLEYGTFFRHWVDKNFWLNRVFYEKPSYLVLGENEHFIEGWRDGEYKMVYSPTANLIQVVRNMAVHIKELYEREDW
jgi:hypothetical protein